MPTYEFRCPDGHEFEKFYRKISDAPSEMACPVCGKPATRLVSGGAGLLFKGSGFYLTDYGRNAHRKPASTDSSTTPESKTTDAKPAESKPAESKPEAKPAAEKKPKKPSPSSGTPKSGA
jgi:putative FmdB family regulatory protein